MNQTPLGLFEGFGIELEYMIVDATTLRVRPVADELLVLAGGDLTTEFVREGIGWSNELARHVIEFKNQTPSPSLGELIPRFSQTIAHASALLERLHCILLPGAAHPFMDPLSETVLWPYENNEIYCAYDALFDCRGHGWSNLQSTHVNLPFADDEQFGRLHAAIRLMLPLIPALFASSPMLDGMLTGLCDARLATYRHNQKRFPLIAGQVIPERAFSREEYEQRILQPLYAQIAPHDPQGILQYEWLNSRGAIARFERNAIEIRTIDIQESPAADTALIELLVFALRSLVKQEWSDYPSQMQWDETELARIMERCIERGSQAIIDNRDFLATFGFVTQGGCTARTLWQHIATRFVQAGHRLSEPVRIALSQGTLAERLLRSLGTAPDHQRTKTVYSNLARCMHSGSSFVA